MWTSMAAVPASRRRSAALRATLYTPNHSRPQASSSGQSRRCGIRNRSRLTSSSNPSRTLPTSSRARDSGPADNSVPRCRIATKAEAQRTTVTPAATRAVGFMTTTVESSDLRLPCRNGAWEVELLTETKSPLLDELNVRILEELTADPRLRTTELARRLGVSTPTVRERVTRLEESGVIRGYRLDIDPAALGRPVAALGPAPAGARSGVPDRRDGPEYAGSRRVPPHLRRGLLPDAGPGPGDRQTRSTPRPLRAVRPDQQLLRRLHPGPAPLGPARVGRSATPTTPEGGLHH